MDESVAVTDFASSVDVAGAPSEGHLHPVSEVGAPSVAAVLDTDFASSGGCSWSS